MRRSFLPESTWKSFFCWGGRGEGSRFAEWECLFVCCNSEKNNDITLSCLHLNFPSASSHYLQNIASNLIFSDQKAESRNAAYAYKGLDVSTKKTFIITMSCDVSI